MSTPRPDPLPSAASPSGRDEPAFLSRPDGARIWFQRHRARARSGDGPGPVVVLCSPGGRNAAYWPLRWVDELCNQGCDVVRFDWRHQGRSVAPRGDITADITADITVDITAGAEHMAADLVALCRHLSERDRWEGEAPAGAPGVPATGSVPAGRVTLVGVGLGGWVAARAAQHPDVAGLAPGGLVLVGSSRWFADPTMEGPEEPVVVALIMRRRGSGPTDLLRALSREVSAERGRSGPLDGEPLRARVETWLAHGFNPEDPYWAHWLAAQPLELSPPADPAPLAERIVVLHGEADPVVPLAHGADLARRLGATLQVITGVGHHVEEPMLQAIATAVLRDAARVEAVRGRSATQDTDQR